jgi:hypothetical protein
METNLLYHDNGNSNTWITVRLVGTASNRAAVGAQVRLKPNIRGHAMWQMREINTGAPSKPTLGSGTPPISTQFASNDLPGSSKPWPMCPKTNSYDLIKGSTNSLGHFTLDSLAR